MPEPIDLGRICLCPDGPVPTHPDGRSLLLVDADRDPT